MTHSVLVTDGDERSALAAVRSLGRAGYRVEVTSTGKRSLAGSSRYAARNWPTPDPLRDPGAYAACLRDIAESESIDLLLPITEASLLSVLPRRENFASTTIPFPSYDRFRSITDKARVVEEARRVGVEAPEQVILPNSEASDVALAQKMEFPVVLKPARSVGGAVRRRLEVGVVHVRSSSELERAILELPPQAFPLLVQEKIEGTGAGVFLLMWKGRLVAHFAHRRIREKPPSGGVSVYRESVRASPTLLDRSVALLERFGWDGIAMVEYKIAETTGEPYIMEVNPRLWGSLQLAIDSGVDFPRLLVDLALGKKVEPVSDYEVGVRTRWWWGEVDHMITRVKQARVSAGYPAALRALYACGRELIQDRHRRNKSEVWSLSDTRPFLLETTDWLMNVWD